MLSSLVVVGKSQLPSQKGKENPRKNEGNLKVEWGREEKKCSIKCDVLNWGIKKSHKLYFYLLLKCRFDERLIFYAVNSAHDNGKMDDVMLLVAGDLEFG